MTSQNILIVAVNVKMLAQLLQILYMILLIPVIMKVTCTLENVSNVYSIIIIILFRSIIIINSSYICDCPSKIQLSEISLPNLPIN